VHSAIYFERRNYARATASACGRLLPDSFPPGDLTARYQAVRLLFAPPYGEEWVESCLSAFGDASCRSGRRITRSE